MISLNSTEFTASDGRRFAFPVGTAFLVLAAILFWRQHETAMRVTAGLGATLYVLGAIMPGKLGPVYRGWMKFGHAIGWFNTRLILGLVFFAVFFPVALVLKLLRKDPMARKLDAGTGSYRVASKAPPREQLERPY